MYIRAYVNPVGGSPIVAITSLMALHNVICGSDPVLLLFFSCFNEKVTSLSCHRHEASTYEKVNRVVYDESCLQILVKSCSFVANIPIPSTKIK